MSVDFFFNAALHYIHFSQYAKISNDEKQTQISTQQNLTLAFSFHIYLMFLQSFEKVLAVQKSSLEKQSGHSVSA